MAADNGQTPAPKPVSMTPMPAGLQVQVRFGSRPDGMKIIQIMIPPVLTLELPFTAAQFAQIRKEVVETDTGLAMP